VQSFLLGQPQLRRILGHPDLSQLRQRVTASYHLGPMSEAETAEYVLHRMELAGWRLDPSIELSALSEIHRFTDGVPRRINTLCTRILLFAALEDLHHIDAAAVNIVHEDLEAEFAQVVEEEPDDSSWTSRLEWRRREADHSS
jgi:general secretion pathway protein A